MPSSRSCCLCGQKSPIVLHSFPKDVHRRSLWKQICNFKDYDDVSRLCVCANHFKTEDYREVNARILGGTLRLKPGIFPTVAVPNKIERSRFSPIAMLHEENSVSPMEIMTDIEEVWNIDGMPSTSFVSDDTINSATTEPASQRMAHHGKNSTNSDQLPSKLNGIIPFAAVYVKEEQPEVDLSTSIEDNLSLNNSITEQHLNGTVPFYNNENFFIKEKSEAPDFRNSEQEINRPVLFYKNEDCFEEKPEVARRKSELQLIENEDYEMNSCLEKNIQCERELEETLHHEIEIKVENEDKHENEADFYGKSTVNKVDSKSTHLKTSKRPQTKRSRQKEFTCGMCDYKTVHSGALKRHQRKHSREKPFVCNKCDYKTIYSESLKRHQIKHSGEKPFVCNFCDYKTAYLINLKRHQLQHSKTKLLVCNQCDYKVNRLDHFKEHQLMHSGQKLFGCAQCDYITIYWRSLKLHQMTHSGEEPFACSLCDFKATESSDLKLHQMMHSGEKPFACSQCDYTTIYSRSLKLHQMTHSGVKLFACNLCDYTTMDSNAYQKHKMEHFGRGTECRYKTNRSEKLKHSGEKPLVNQL